MGCNDALHAEWACTDAEHEKNTLSRTDTKTTSTITSLTSSKMGCRGCCVARSFTWAVLLGVVGRVKVLVLFLG